MATPRNGEWRVASPLKEEVWEQRLKGCKWEEEILQVVRFGFRFVDEEEVSPVDCNNYSSFDEGGEAVDSVLRDEVKKEWIIPWTAPSLPRFIAARGAIPKGDSTELRLITDLSRPKGRSINDYVESQHFKMDTVDKVMGWMRPGCWLFKIDIRHAYRNIPIHPSNWEVTAFRWAEKIWADIRLSFGLRSAPWIFSRFSVAVVWMMNNDGWKKISAYLDDFLGLEEQELRAWQKFQALWSLLEELGFPINDREGKVCRPSQKVKFLGVMLDSISMTASLPLEKVEKIKQWCATMSGKRKAQVREVQRLVGLLNFAARVVRGGRTFLRRMIDVMRGAPSYHHVKLDEGFHLDLKWWTSFIQDWNGVEVIYENMPISSCSLQTDAAKTVGCAAVFEEEELFFQWPPEWDVSSINELEIYPVLLASQKWGHIWRGKVVLVLSDNTTVVSAINKGTSSSSKVMVWLRELFWLSAKGGFEIRAVHLAGHLNILADLLSRGKWEEYWEAKGWWLRAKKGENELWTLIPWLKAIKEQEDEGIKAFKTQRGLRA